MIRRVAYYMCNPDPRAKSALRRLRAGVVRLSRDRVVHVIMSVIMGRYAMARDPGDLSPLCSRSLELRAFTFIHGRKAVYHHGVRHRLRLHGGAVPDDAQAFLARNLQHDRPRRVNLIAANASSGESTNTCCNT